MRAVVVDAGTSCLRVLKLAANAVDATVFAQSGTRLMKIERDSLLDTLSANIEHPIVVAHPRLAARLASYRHLVDVAVEQAVKIERAQQWFAEEKPMTYGQSFEDGQPPVELFLIFDGTGDGYMGIPVAPVVGQSYPESVDALGGNDERQIAPLTYHIPSFGAPFVGLGKEEIGGKTGIDLFARGNTIVAVALAFYRQVESCRAGNHTAVFAIQAVPPIDVAVPAPFTYLAATMP